MNIRQLRIISLLMVSLSLPSFVEAVGNCPDKWLHAYNQRLCMKFSDNSLGYAAAEARCQADEALMLTYNNLEELLRVMGLFKLSGSVRVVQHGLQYNPNTLQATIPDGSTVYCDFCDSLNYTGITNLPACIAITITEKETTIEASTCASRHFVCSKAENSLLAGIPFTAYDAVAAACGALIIMLLVIAFLCCKAKEEKPEE